MAEPGPPGSGLPSSGHGVPVDRLAAIFQDRTTSYKLLFFQAILKELARGQFGNPELRLADLAAGMLVIAAHPVRYFRLSLGVADQVGVMLQRIDYSASGVMREADLDAAVRRPEVRATGLLRFVPARLLTPFFAADLRGLKDHVKDAAIRKLATDRFETVRPLYRFVGSPDGPDRIELNPDWLAYLRDNYPVVQGWADRHWISYLQSRNTTVPGIAEKIGRPEERPALSEQRKFWRDFLQGTDGGFPCLYTGNPVPEAGFDLDHFVPRSFVAHDGLWNLVPVLPVANQSKGNQLPDLRYLEPFIDRQHEALQAARARLGRAAWARVSQVYVGDLRVTEDQLMDRQDLGLAIASVIRPQIDLARMMGFEAGWVWEPRIR